MRSKRITALLMAVLMVVGSASGCRKSGDQETSAGTEAATEAVPTVEAVEIADEDALLVGEEGIGGIFNPLFARSKADQMVCDLVFDTVCAVDELGELQDAAGHLERLSGDENAESSSGSGEGASEDTEKKKAIEYQLTLNKGLKFSNGADVTIDDVIFTWKLMADPYYEGPYALAEVPVLGMQEYYYDTRDVEAYKKKLKNYSSKDISEEDFIAYLIDTKLNGWFDGNLPGDLDGKGTTWVNYLESNGYDAAGIEENADELLKLLAKCEYEHYSFSYDPYTYYQKKVHEDLLSGGIEVSDIEGIQKIDEYSCKLQFTSVDAKTLRAMTVIPILSRDYYGAGYEKGAIAKLEHLNGVPMGSGSYVFNAFSKDEVSLIVSDSSRVQSASKYVKIKSIEEKEKGQALQDGTVALASLSVNSSLERSDKLEAIPVEGSGFYYFGINTDMVNRPGIREGIMALIDKSLLTASEEQIMEVIGKQGDGENTDTSVIHRVSGQLSLTPQTWPMTRISTYYPNIASLLEKKKQANGESSGDTEGAPAKSTPDAAETDVFEYSLDAARSKFGQEGYWNDGNMLAKSGEQLKLNMGISEELPNQIKAVAYQLKSGLEELGASITLKEYSEADMQATIPTAAFDLWIGAFTGLEDYDMEDYLRYGAEKNYFHHQNGYADMQFEEAREAEDESHRAQVLKEIWTEVMGGAYCRPLCQAISEAYVVNTSMADLTDMAACLNEYDSFSEVISGIKLK